VICEKRKTVLKLLAHKLEELSKATPSPALIDTVDKLIEISHIIDTSTPCAPQSRSYWKQIETLLYKVSKNNIPYSRNLSSLLLEVIPKIQESEKTWYNSLKVSLALSTFLSFFGYGPFPISYLYLISWLISFPYPLWGGILALLSSVLLASSYLPLGLVLGLLILTSIVAYTPPSITLSVSEKEVIRVSSEEEIVKLFKEIYGREGEKLFKFELWQLMSAGYSKEEALKELWVRLTGEKS